MLAVFEHIEVNALAKLLVEVLRILKPGGIFIMTTPAGWTGGLLSFLANINMVSREEIDEHKDAYSFAKIIPLLQSAGFEREDSQRLLRIILEYLGQS